MAHLSTLGCALSFLLLCRWRELAKTKYLEWQQNSKQRTAAAATLKQHLDGLLQLPPGSQPQGLHSSSMQADLGMPHKQSSVQDVVQQQWQALFDRAAHLDVPTEVPSHLLCPLTMEVSAAGQPAGQACAQQVMGGCAKGWEVGAMQWVDRMLWVDRGGCKSGVKVCASSSSCQLLPCSSSSGLTWTDKGS